MTIPFRLTRRGWGFTVSAALIWGSWHFVGLRILLYLVAFLGAFVFVGLLSVVFLLIVGKCEATVSASDPTPVVGEVVGLSAQVRQRFLGRSALTVVWRIDGQKLRSAAVSQTRKISLAHEQWYANRRGSVRVQVLKAEFTDPLGLVVGVIRMRGDMDLLVLPRVLTSLLENGDIARSVLDDEGVAAVQDASGSPAGAVREYRTGDALRQIHWKQSARQGELLVNLNESPLTTRRSLFLVTAKEAYSNIDDFEFAVSVAATVAVMWVRLGHRVLLSSGIPGGRLEDSCWVESEGDVLRNLAVTGIEVASDALPWTSGLEAQAVVTGNVPSFLYVTLERWQGGGSLFVTSEVSSLPLPPGWVRVPVPRQVSKLAGSFGVFNG